MDTMKKKSLSFIIFGATGDLTKRKLIPAFYNLELTGELIEDINIVAIGRRDYTNDEYLNILKEAAKKYSRASINNNIWDNLKTKINYLKMDYTVNDDYDLLKAELDKYQSEKIYYLAVSPEHFTPIVNNLKSHGLGETKNEHPKIVIEKPFGSNLETAKILNQSIVDVFSEENVYRIDHYLGKEMLQNIMVIRFSNLMFEPVWNNNYIKKVIINSSETIGIGTRGNYFENFGIIRDMLQSHLLQLISLVAMEKPISLDNNEIRNKKIEILNSFKSFSEESLKSNIIRGQYESYKDEDNVDSSSSTETYIALKMEIENQRWQGVPFYIRTGKKLPRKSTEIIIEFKEVENNLYHNSLPNYLVFKIQPEEGIFLSFNTKKIGNTKDVMSVKMDYCQNCEIGFNSPEAYERLIFDVIEGDQTLFARWDEVEYSWRFIDQIVDYWHKHNPTLHIYKDNTWGPKSPDELANAFDEYLDLY